MDIRPPRKKINITSPGQAPSQRPAPRASSPRPEAYQQPVVEQTPEYQRDNLDVPQHAAETPAKKRMPTLVKWLIGLLTVVIVAGIALAAYAMHQLSPVRSGASAQRFVVEKGTGPQAIAKNLKTQGIIRDDVMFYIYARLIGKSDNLQAGNFMLSPSDSSQKIINQLVAGKTESFNLTFYPGATLKDTTTAEKKRTDVTTMLLRAGYSADEIAAGLAKKYTHPALASKPDSASLEGYIYGDTYSFPTGTKVETIITRTLDELYKVIKSENLESKFKARGLTLHQGIILASIVQREVHSDADMKQVAQVFYTRLANDTVLGSDVTFIYAARQLGVLPRVDLDSPYNTRRVKGLPPGPIASPGKAALIATASPAAGDYFYFVAGDDGKTYFSRTEAEHNALAAKHCIKLCSEF